MTEGERGNVCSGKLQEILDSRRKRKFDAP